MLNSNRLSLAITLAALSCTVTSVQAAPGELDPYFNGGLGYASFVAPAGTDQPSASAICLDDGLRPVVAAALRISTGPDQWQGQLLRTSAGGVPDNSLAPGYWRTIGSAVPMNQIPSLRCDPGRYVLASIAGTSSPYSVRLDLIAPTGSPSSSTQLPSNLHALQPRIALATASYGRWWVGPAMQFPFASPTSGTSSLQLWLDNGGVLQQDISNSASAFAGPFAQYTDAAVDSSRRVYAIGRFQLSGNYNAYVQRFNQWGVQDYSIDGGVAMVQTADHDYGQRIALGSDGARVYAGTTVVSVTNPLVTRVRVVRLLGSTGLPDTSFASAGAWTLHDAELGDVMEDGSGRVLIAGRHQGAAFVTRLLANGTPDLSFGPNGERQFGFGSTDARFDGITLDLNGRIVLAGTRFAAQRGGQTIPAAVIVARVQN